MLESQNMTNPTTNIARRLDQLWLQTLYESAVAFGMRKALQTEQGKNEMEARIGQLEGDVKDLERQVCSRHVTPVGSCSAAGDGDCLCLACMPTLPRPSELWQPVSSLLILRVAVTTHKQQPT